MKTPSAAIVSAGRNDLPKVVLTHRGGASAEIYLHGAHVTSWKDAGGDELLFLSRQSNWSADKPIRGGIPICFPQFSSFGTLAAHGFARTSEWTLTQTEQRGDVSATLQLCESETTLRLWPHRFSIELRVMLAENSLTLAMRVSNRGDQPFSFTTALHTYFAVADIRRATVSGLQGATMLDTLRNNARELDTRTEIRFDRETDLIYPNAPDCVRIRDEVHQRTISVEKNGMSDVVVWNPWVAKAQRLQDFGDDEYLRMVCVETGVTTEPLKLAPQQQWKGRTILRYETSR